MIVTPKWTYSIGDLMQARIFGTQYVFGVQEKPVSGPKPLEKIASTNLSCVSVYSFP